MCFTKFIYSAIDQEENVAFDVVPKSRLFESLMKLSGESPGACTICSICHMDLNRGTVLITSRCERYRTGQASSGLI